MLGVRTFYSFSFLVTHFVGLFWYCGPESRAPAALPTASVVESSALPSKSILPLSIPNDIDFAKARLGRSLFSDVRLSHGNQISCLTCHDFNKGGTDNLQFSRGVEGRLGEINAPTVLNSGFNFKQFWNGRAEDLIEQAGGPVSNPIEMASGWAEVVSKLSVDPQMVRNFQQVYHEPISANLIAGALAEFERALVTLNAPFDHYLRGDKTALSPEQVRGYQKFTQYGCVSCHQGQNVGGNMFQTMGLAHNYFADRGGTLTSDLGRFAVTKSASDMHVFKVPSLRNVALTAPYFHDGSEPSLANAVRKMGRYQLGRRLPDNDVNDLVEFLRSLTGEMPAILNVKNDAS